MATQPTNNPVPSESPRDLKFNAGKIDEFVTSPSGEYTDRLGGRHKTVSGMEADFENQLSSQSDRFNTQLSGQEKQFTDQITSQSDQFNYFIQNSGYEVVGDYENGPLTINSYNQIIRYQGEFYKLTGATEIPWTTTGNDTTSWAIDSAQLVGVADAALRQELAGNDGLKQIGQCPDIITLRSTEPEMDGQRIVVREYTIGTGHGGGTFVYWKKDTTSADDGGYIIVTKGGKRWKRDYDPKDLHIEHFGAIPDGRTDCIKAIKMMDSWSQSQTDNCSLIGVQFPGGDFAVSSWDTSDTYRSLFRLAGAGGQFYGYNNPTKLILIGDAGSVAFSVQSRRVEIINLEIYAQYDIDGKVRHFFKNICPAGQYIRVSNFRASYVGGRTFQLMDTLDAKFDQFYTSYTYDNIFRVLASGTTSGGWNHSTAVELTNFNIQHHLCEESQQGALFIPNCGQSLIWNGWIEHCTYPGNLTLGQWNIHSLSMETNTNPLYMSQSRFMNYLFSNPTGKGIDVDTQMTVAYDTGEYTSRSVSTYEKGYGEWNTHGLYLNSPIRYDFNATQKYVSNITAAPIWVYVGHFFLPTLAQTMNLRVIGRAGYSSASTHAGIDGSAIISIQNRSTASSTVSWHAPRNGGILDVVYTQPYERDTHIYVKIPAYSRVGFFAETNGLLRKDTGTPTYIQWDMSIVADISTLTTQDAVSTCSLGTTSAGIIADGENNLLYLYSAADTVGELDVLKLGVNDKIKSLPLMSGGAWKLPVYYFEDLPAAGNNWWSICICRAFICADNVVYKTQVVHSDGTYWRPQQNPSTYIIGSA